MLNKAAEAFGQEDSVNFFDDGTYSIRTESGVFLTTNPSLAMKAMCADDESEIIVLSEDVITPGIRTAQWGGHAGGQGSGGSGLGGPGAGSPMGGVLNFDNPMARQQFDISLDGVRKSPSENGWDRSMETRLQDHPLYGHKRNEKDKNIESYALSFRERVKKARERYLERVIANREKQAQRDKERSVESIKSIPGDPKHFTSVETKLKDRRQQEDPDPNYKRPQHGPESMFVYYPRPQMKTAAKVGGPGSTIFAPWHDVDDIREQLHQPKKTHRTQPAAAGESLPGGTERGLATLHGGSPVDSSSPSVADDPFPDRDEAYSGRHEAANALPWAMHGRLRENDMDFGELDAKMWGDGPRFFHREYLSDRWMDPNANPGEQTWDVSRESRYPGTFPKIFDPENAERYIRRVRDNFAPVSPEVEGWEPGETTEKKLQPQRRNKTRMTEPYPGLPTDWEKSPYPWLTSRKPSGRDNRSHTS